MPNRHVSNLFHPKLGSLLVLLLAAAMLLLPGCAEPPEPAPQPAAARSQVEQGPVQLTVEVTPQPARLADNPVMTITLTVEQGVTIEKPEFGAAFGEFLIRDFHEPLVETRDEQEILRQIYTLEPTQTGEQLIPPITIAYRDMRAGDAAPQQTLTSEPLMLSVTSEIASTPPVLDAAKPQAGPVLVEETPNYWLWGIAAVLVIAAAAILWHWLRRRAARPALALSPREQAERELEQLIAAGLARQDVKRFYVELTGILRQYIERTTGVQAPEQTTEEFLQAIGRSSRSTESERTRLKEFLEAADLVKFAAQHPREEDITESIERARDFIRLGVAAPREVAA